MSKFLTAVLLFLLFEICSAFITPQDPYSARTNYCPQWSPDGAKIIFYSQIKDRWQILAMNSDGSNMKRISSGDYNDFYPSFSPNSDTILFYSDREGNPEIYTMDANGKNAIRLTRTPIRERMPRWSPDGKRIAYVASEQNTPGELFVMNADGTNSIQLTKASEINVVSRIAWSPDGKQIIFYASNDGKDMSGENQWALFSIPVSGGSPKRIGEWGRDSNPHWSAASSLIAVDAHQTGNWESEDGKWEIFSFKPDGTARKNLTSNENRNDWAPSWSPDGKKIAYCSGMNDRYEIYVMNADGTNPKRLTFNVMK